MSKIRIKEKDPPSKASQESISNTSNKFAKPIKEKAPSKASANGIFNALAFILATMLLIGLVRTLIGGEIPTFASFLEMLTNTPNIDITFIAKLNEAITINSGVQWLDTIVNMLSSIIVVIVYIGTGIAQLLTYVVYIIGWIFA